MRKEGIASLKLSVKKKIITSLFSSLVIIFTFIKIPIPIGNGTTMLHLGNVVCLLSGLVLGPVYGGLAAGVGSFIFDLLNPMYLISAPFSLIFKFIMAFLCGKINKSKLKKFKVLLATSCGSGVYIILHCLKNYITNRCFYGFSLELSLLLLGKGFFISGLNAIFSVAISILIYREIRRREKKSTSPS